VPHRPIALAALILAALATPVAAQSYPNRPVRLVIGFAAGGGTDLSGRLIVSFLGKYLPGEPNVIAQNVPGAEGMNAMNFQRVGR